MSKDLDFRSTILSLWFRLTTLAITALVFVEALILGRGKAQGWSFYLTPLEVTFEVIVRLIAAALVGMALGSISVAVLLPVLWFMRSSRPRAADWITKAAVFVTVFLVSRFALDVVIKWSYQLHNHPALLDKLVWAAFYLAFAAALFLPRARKQVVTSMDGLLSDTMTRRTALATVAGTAALVTTEFILSKSAPTVRAAVATTRPKSNVLLITFDALSAEDMSLYGYRLPTTPNIDAFARKSTVFTNFYSASTFTTPSVATMLTGLFPSESYVYQLRGRVRPRDIENSLPYQMRAGGYATGAFFSNPFAYYFGKSIENQYDFLPEPVFHKGGVQRLWDATEPLHQDSGFGSRIDEYFDVENAWSDLLGLPYSVSLRYRAAPSFEHAREMLAKLPDGFFLWIHVMTPHWPYLPDAADRGRFFPADQPRRSEEEGKAGWKPHYPPDQQREVDQQRLWYDEFIATADRDFGAFMTELSNSGKLQNTTVVVSADHGESFEGGVFQHETAYLTRPVIHIPLLIRTPGQEEGYRIAYVADNTSLTPTILELAGIPKPSSMRGQSLAGWLKGGDPGKDQGRAFCQFLEKNSVFKPVRNGSVGVIEGEFQYVVYLDTQKGELRPLAEAQYWNLDRSAESPERAKALRGALNSRFPDLVRKEM
jgi:arylsulfatase A-like enzyme